ncbi:MAG: SDR family NAD(P)-dependent oxidoreductase, partial [Tannerella sp.]|nr:SDR family NAD(P)-dependent oxidoreductase [Tannerella sp.]
MHEKIDQLIHISRKFGSDNRYVIAGGGNTSYKNEEHIWVKASGYALATITENGFALLDRKKLNIIAHKKYSKDDYDREEEVKNDLLAACITKECRPSVETSLHNAFEYAFVVHLHPTAVCGLMCSKNAESVTKKLFGDEAVYIPYEDPGYKLSMKVSKNLTAYKVKNGKHPHILFLQNHGVFVAADTIEEIESTYNRIITQIEEQISPFGGGTLLLSPFGGGRGRKDIAQNENECDYIEETIPPIRMMLSKQGGLKALKIRTNSRTLNFASSKTEFQKIAVPFTPDETVYCKSNYIYLSSENKEDLLNQAQNKIRRFILIHGYTPKILVIKGVGIVAVGNSAAECDTILDSYEDAMKIAEIAQSFGGEHPMTKHRIKFIDNWEVENYRRKVNTGIVSGRTPNKTIIITGAAKGFGEGIAECLLKEGANIVVADLDEDAGKATVERLQGLCNSYRILFVKTDVADPKSLQNLIRETVRNFGGLDVFISNAGVLRAGGLENFTPEEFEFVTNVNYKAYFYCS